jgi:hypothetical protein
LFAKKKYRRGREADSEAGWSTLVVIALESIDLGVIGVEKLTTGRVIDDILIDFITNLGRKATEEREAVRNPPRRSTNRSGMWGAVSREAVHGRPNVIMPWPKDHRSRG